MPNLFSWALACPQLEEHFLRPVARELAESLVWNLPAGYRLGVVWCGVVLQSWLICRKTSRDATNPQVATGSRPNLRPPAERELRMMYAR